MAVLLGVEYLTPHKPNLKPPSVYASLPRLQRLGTAVCAARRVYHEESHGGWFPGPFDTGSPRIFWAVMEWSR
ncbi:unnamed protein product [Gadus morhua 'NCC']